MTPHRGAALRWLLLYAAATTVFAIDYRALRPSYGVLVYLLIIVGASATVGRFFAFVMVFASYLSVDWFFIPPIGRFGAPRNLDGIIIAGFLGTGFAVSQLLSSFRESSERASRRAAEVERLSEERRHMAEELARGRALQEADAMKNALLSSVAHDLRTPLATIARLAADGGPHERAIADESARLTTYLDSLIAFARADKATPQREVNVAEDLIGAAVRSAESSLAGRALTVHTPPDGELLVGEFDFNLALRSLVNLLDNAARYSPADAPIEVVLARAERRLSITVLDRGCGIAADEVERLFDPFERGRDVEGRPGSGLGLSIARTFARAQGGDVRYAAREGGGAAFTLELPSRLAD